MTLDVEKLAREAGGSLWECDCVGGPEWHLSSRELERFASLVLEEAAKACEDRFSDGALVCAEAIRALLPAQD